MAKRTKKTKVFLIVDSNDERDELANGLRNAGYDVHDYMTAREFLVDKQNYSGGVVVTEYRTTASQGLNSVRNSQMNEQTFLLC